MLLTSTMALYCARFSFVNTWGSSLTSTVYPSFVPIALIASSAAGIESWRKPVLPEYTSTFFAGFAAAARPGSTRAAAESRASAIRLVENRRRAVMRSPSYEN